MAGPKTTSCSRSMTTTMHCKAGVEDEGGAGAIFAGQPEARSRRPNPKNARAVTIAVRTAPRPQGLGGKRASSGRIVPLSRRRGGVKTEGSSGVGMWTGSSGNCIGISYHGEECFTIDGSILS